MILGLLWMLVANAASLAGAGALLPRVRAAQGPADAAIFLLLRLLFISAAVLLCGLSGFLTPWGLGILGAIALAGLLATGSLRKPERPALPDMGPLGWTLLLVAAARLVLQVWFFAPHYGDVLTYHLPKVAEWVRSGRLISEVGMDPRAHFPAGFELVETWWVVFLHHDVLIEMAGVEFLALAVTSAYALARRIGLAERGACLTAALYGMTPTLHLQATSCFNDLPVAATVACTAALIAGRAPAGLLLAAAGLGIGIKPSYAYVLPGLALYYWLGRREPAEKSPCRHWPWAAAAPGIILGLFWYARNRFLHGSTIYPFGSPKDVIHQNFLGVNLPNLVDQHIYDSLAAYGASGDSICGWGAAAFGCGLPALVPALREDTRLRHLALSFGVGLVVVLAIVAPDPWCMRFVLFFPLLLCLAVSWLAQRHRWVEVVVGFALVSQFVGTTLPTGLPIGGLRDLARQGWRGRTSAPSYIRDLPAEAIACGPGSINDVYRLYGPDFSRRVRYIQPYEAREILALMEREGIRFIQVSSTIGPVADLMRKGRLRRRAQNILERVP